MAAPSWQVFRETFLRPLLKDDVVGNTTPRWSDAELLANTNYGIDAISWKMPLVKSTTLAFGFRSYDLPDDLWEVDAVQDLVTDEVYREAKVAPGEIVGVDLATSLQDQMYVVDWPTEGKLTFTMITKNPVRLVYEAYRSRLAADSDVLPIGRHRWMEQAIAYYAACLCHLGESVSRSSLEQWSAKPENIVGNPFLLVAKAFFEHYERVLRENTIREMPTYGG